MSSELVRGLIALVLAGLLFVQGRGALPLRRRAFTIASPGIALLGIANIALSLGLPSGLVYAMIGLGLGLILLGLIFLVRSWQRGELREQVRRYQEQAAREREQREADQDSTSR
jgi:GAF domain-containing protein